MSVSADTINLTSGTINTQLAGGASGAITFAGKNILLDTGTGLNAAASGTDGTAGAYSVTVSDITYHYVSLPLDFTAKSVSISLEGATIQGGNVTIGATATNSSVPSETSALGFGYVGQLLNLLNQISGEVLGGFAGIDAAVTLRGANAAVTVDNSSITSSGTVDIASTTDAEAQVTAVAQKFINANPLSASAAYGQATSTVTTTISGDSDITAAQNVSITATGTVVVSASATASANLVGSANSNATSIAVAVGYTDLIDTATVGNQATVDATQGSVAIDARGTEKDLPSASTVAYDNGTAGITAGLAFDDANVQANVDGTVKAGGLLVPGGGHHVQPERR